MGNKWTLPQRTALWLLSTRFPLRDIDMSRIFNKMFADDLAECGYRTGVKADKLSDEYKFRTKPGRPKMWNEICNTDGQQAFEQTEENKIRIEKLLKGIWAVAEDMKIGLAEGGDVWDTIIETERLEKLEADLLAGDSDIKAGEKRIVTCGLDSRVYNLAFCEAHPTLTFSDKWDKDQHREPVAPAWFRRVKQRVVEVADGEGGDIEGSKVKADKAEGGRPHS